MSLSIANYLLYIGYMLASVAMAVLFSFTYLLTTPARELHLIKQGNVACALSFGGALVGFCLALASAMTHSLNILDFILWSAGAAVVQIGAYFATTRLIPDAGRELQQINALLLPHIATLVLLMLVALAMILGLRADFTLELELLLAPALLWLMGGTIGWFAYLPHLAEWTDLIAPTTIVLLIIAVCLFSGCRKRHGNSGKWLISLAVWLWFAYGFVLLGVQY